MARVKCVKCKRDATYDSPEDLCDEHWAEWWAAIVTDPKKRRQYQKETLATIKASQGCQRMEA